MKLTIVMTLNHIIQLLVYSVLATRSTNSRTFSSPQKEASLLIPSSSKPWQKLIYFVSMGLLILDTSYVHNHTLM